MAAGYAFGSLLQLEAERRRAVLIRLGGALVLGFAALHALNLYGDPEPWSGQGTALYTLFSFLKVEKYPPSLLYLLLTIGAAVVALGVLDGRPGPFGRFLTTYGRAPCSSTCCTYSCSIRWPPGSCWSRPGG